MLNYQIKTQLRSLIFVGLSGKTNREIHDQCVSVNNTHADAFPVNDEPVDADIFKGGVFLGCAFKPAAL